MAEILRALLRRRRPQTQRREDRTIIYDLNELLKVNPWLNSTANQVWLIFVIEMHKELAKRREGR